jgi:exodeoxyribonuclease VII small subunit
MAQLNYEEARDELQKIVATLESGNIGLEESLKLWQRGEELAAICQEWLDGARSKLESAKKIEGLD